MVEAMGVNSRSAACVGRIEVGTELVPRHAGGRFDLQDAFRRNANAEFLHGLVGHADRLSQLTLSAGDSNGAVERGLCWVAHANQSTTDSCNWSTTDSCEQGVHHATYGCSS